MTVWLPRITFRNGEHIGTSIPQAQPGQCTMQLAGQLVRFTSCSDDDFYGGLMACADDDNLFHRSLHGHTYTGMWSIYYPPKLTPNEALSLCTFTTTDHNDQSPCTNTDLIIKKLGHHHVELIDEHGGTNTSDAIMGKGKLGK